MSRANSLAVEDLGSAAQRDRHKRILDATTALASQGGFDAVQMRAVAEQADVALGTLYRYFPSKIHLLVSALQREFERTEVALRDEPVEGDSSADRVISVLQRTTGRMKGEPQLAEALVRAFMFADASVRNEIRQVSMLLTAMLTRAMHPPGREEVSVNDVAVARVIGDAWFAALVGWVTGRSTAAETAQQIEVAVRLLLRD